MHKRHTILYSSTLAYKYMYLPWKKYIFNPWSRSCGGAADIFEPRTRTTSQRKGRPERSRATLQQSEIADFQSKQVDE